MTGLLAAPTKMLHIFLLLAATSVLSCNVRPVRNLTMTDASSSTISLRWITPSDEDLKCVRGYMICETERDFYKCARVHNASMNEYTINNLKSCTLYHVSVMAIGEDYAVSRKAELVETTAPAPVIGLRVERRDEDTITALWNYIPTSRGYCATKFQLSLCDANESSCNNTEVAVASGVWDYGVIGYSQVLHKRPDCNAYTVTIVALDKYQHRSDNFSFPSRPDLVHVRNLATSDVSSSMISLNWTMLSGEDLQCVRGYKICATQGSLSPICVSVYNASMNEYTINNLTSCSTYYVTVVAVGENNTDSRTSDLVEITAPAPVTYMEVERIDDDTITALWNYTKTSERTCVTKFQLSICDAAENNCNHKEVAATSDYQYSQVLHKKPDRDAYSINIVALDIYNQTSENLHSLILPELVGAAGHVRHSVIIMSTMLCLLILFTALQF